MRLNAPDRPPGDELTRSGQGVSRRRRLLVTGAGLLAVGTPVLRRRSRGWAAGRDGARESNWSQVQRDEPNLREARSMR
jgi:hypothetical protein